MMRVIVLTDEQAQALKDFVVLKMKPNGFQPSDALIAAATKLIQDVEGQTSHRGRPSLLEQLEEDA